MKLNKTAILIATLSASLLLNGCIGDNNSNNQSAGNNSLANIKSQPSVSPLVLRGENEHHIERPSDEKRKEEYDKIKDKVVVDNDANKPARQDQKDVIHQLLEKVPSELTQQFNKLDGKIKLISNDWQDSLQKDGVKISSETKVINKFGKPVHISDAIVYFDSSSLHPIIYINSNVNYVNNADNRKELEYSLVRGLLKSNNIILDKDFVNAVKSYTQVSGIEYYNYPELEAISQFSVEDIQRAENQDKMATLFASIMADYLVNKEYAKIWSVMTNYLDEFKQNIILDTVKFNKEETHKRVLDLIKSKIFKSEHIGELKYDKEIFKDSKVYRLYRFQGIVYRGDNRGPSEIKQQSGFNNDYTKELKHTILLDKLSDPLSALQVPEEGLTSLYAALGFFSNGSTHDIGVSTTKAIQQAAKYPPRAEVRYIYLIDNTQLIGYDIPSVTRQISTDQSTFISNDEVNMFENIPFSAIVGYSYIMKQETYGSSDQVISILNSRITKNDSYMPSPWAISIKN